MKSVPQVGNSGTHVFLINTSALSLILRNGSALGDFAGYNEMQEGALRRPADADAQEGGKGSTGKLTLILGKNEEMERGARSVGQHPGVVIDVEDVILGGSFDAQVAHHPNSSVDRRI